MGVPEVSETHKDALFALLLFCMLFLAFEVAVHAIAWVVAWCTALFFGVVVC